MFSRLDFPIYRTKKGAFLNFVDDGLTNAILFIDVKKTFDAIQLTCDSFAEIGSIWV